MYLKEVKDKKSIRAFEALPFRIYRKDAHWVAPLLADLRAVFDPRKNPLFQKGVLKRWIVLDEERVVGRIAAFVHTQYVNPEDTQTPGGIGFFECEDNVSYARLLFDTAKGWLQSQGCTAMDGPINFGDRDKFWGLLVSGFAAPLYGMNYHPPYYEHLFKSYGFRVYYEQYCLGVAHIRAWRHKQVDTISAYLEQKYRYKAVCLQKKDLNRFARDFTVIYNDAWASHKSEKVISEAQAVALFSKMAPMIEEGLCWYLYEDAEPLAVFLCLPDLNFYFKHIRGRLGLWQKIQVLYRKYFGRNTKVVGLIFGIRPQVQSKGVGALLIRALRNYLFKTRYRAFEMMWIGDFNKNMLKMCEGIAPERTRVLQTLRYVFDAGQPFKRHPYIS